MAGLHNGVYETSNRLDPNRVKEIQCLSDLGEGRGRTPQSLTAFTACEDVRKSGQQISSGGTNYAIF